MSGNISGGAIKRNLKKWLSIHPFISGVLSNPLIISILILTIIWLLDLLYGKNFECATPREILQHFSTALFVMGAGIILNNLAVSATCTPLSEEEKVEKKVSGHGPCGCETDINPVGAGVSPEKYDNVLSQYVE